MVRTVSNAAMDTYVLLDRPVTIIALIRPVFAAISAVLPAPQHIKAHHD
ncbi:hypothetical protein [Mycobacterium lepromatosis]